MSAMDSQLGYSEVMGRGMRLGSAEALSMSTRELAIAALRGGDRAGAREYLEYEIAEVGTMLEYLSGWLAGMLEIARNEVDDFESEALRLPALLGAAPP